MNQPPISPDLSPDTRLRRLWRAEAIRLREARWGPLDDSQVLQAVLQGPSGLARRILRRADLLGAREGLSHHLSQWAASARIALVLVWGLALCAGIGTAASVLGTGVHPVNLALALLGLLGLHAVTLLIWLLSLLPGLVPPPAGLSGAWLWLTGKLVRGPDTVLAAPSLASLLTRARTWHSIVGGVSHAAWCLAFLGASATLLVLLSTRRYVFQWETTLLSPETFVAMVHALGSVPAWLGFPMPDSTIIARSDGLHLISAAAQADWSAWLIGCVLTWGLLPRLLAGLACLVVIRRRLQHLDVDTSLPGWLELRDRLMPPHQSLGVDAPAPKACDPAHGIHPRAAPTAHADAILGFELGPDTPWPPPDLPDRVRDMGLCDSREDRRRILDQLLSPPARLLLACDARQTPDRGTLAWLAQLQNLCPQIEVLLLQGPGRSATWRQALTVQGIHEAPSLIRWIDPDTPEHHA